jgi:rhamnose utilization protein RhaD (predicted bifunctional aldolase and dehydrogenase)
MGLDELAALSRRYGSDAHYVIAGGGNTSFKTDDTLYVKASGFPLATATPESFARMDRRKLAAIWDKHYSNDPALREAAVLADMMAARASGEDKRPSVETLLHDMLPFAYVVHLHPALVNGVTCSQQGEAAVRALFGNSVLWVPSVNPGYVLSCLIKDARKAYAQVWGKEADIIMQQNHGIFVAADSPESMIEKYDYVMNTIQSKVKREPDYDRDIMRLVQSRESFAAVDGAFTPDHIVYAGARPLFVEREEDIPVNPPRIVAVKGVGARAFGPSKKAADTALELFKDAVAISVYAENFGGGRFMDQEQVDFICNWEVEQYRSSVANK